MCLRYFILAIILSGSVRIIIKREIRKIMILLIKNQAQQSKILCRSLVIYVIQFTNHEVCLISYFIIYLLGNIFTKLSIYMPNASVVLCIGSCIFYLLSVSCDRLLSIFILKFFVFCRILDCIFSDKTLCAGRIK